MKTKNLPRSLLIGGASSLLLIALLVGGFLAFSDRNGGAIDPSEETQANADTGDSNNISLDEFDLSQINSKETLFARRLALYNLVDSSDENTLSRLLGQTRHMPPGTLRRETEDAVVRKWASINPENVLTSMESMLSLRHRDLLPIVFEEWSRSDLKAAISYASQFGPANRKIVFDSIRASRTDIDDTKAMEIAGRLNLDFYASQQMFVRLSQSPIADPEESWNQFMQEHQNRLRGLRWFKNDYLRSIARALADSGGVDALHRVSESLTNANDRLIAIPPIVYALVKSDPQGALDFALSQQRDETSLTWSVASIWADADPKSALSAVSNIEEFQQRVYLQEAVIDRWCRTDPFALMKDLSNLPESSRQLAEEKARIAVAERSPQEATKTLLEIEDSSLRAKVAAQIASSWAKRDFDAALDWVHTEASLEPIRDQVVGEMLRVVTRTNPQLALDTALEQSVPKDAIGPEAAVISVVARYSPDAAIELLPVARNEATRVASLLAIGSQLIGWGTDESQDKAIQLVDQLNSDDARHEYLSVLMFRWDLEDLYDRLSQLPTLELQEQAASYILSNDRENLTVTQIRELESLVSKKD